MRQNLESDSYNAPNASTAEKPSKTTRRSRIKHYDVFPERHSPVQGERAVWVGVITQALMDALSKSRTAEALYHKHEAIQWLTGNSHNFIMVCQLAGFEPSNIRRKAKRALVSPKEWRLPAGKGKRYMQRKAYRARKASLVEPA